MTQNNTREQINQSVDKGKHVVLSLYTHLSGRIQAGQ